MNDPGWELELLLRKCISDENWYPEQLEFYMVNAGCLMSEEGLKLGLATALGILQYKHRDNAGISSDVEKILAFTDDINEKNFISTINKVIKAVKDLMERYNVI